MGLPVNSLVRNWICPVAGGTCGLLLRLGIISKKAYKRSNGQVCSDEDSGLINEAVLFLDITWRTAIGLTGLGWLVYSLLIVTGQTILPAYLGLLTPLPLSLLTILLVEKLRIGRPYLNGAGLT